LRYNPVQLSADIFKSKDIIRENLSILKSIGIIIEYDRVFKINKFLIKKILNLNIEELSDDNVLLISHIIDFEKNRRKLNMKNIDEQSFSVKHVDDL
jgi:hypothetical protein